MLSKHASTKFVLQIISLKIIYRNNCRILAKCYESCSEWQHFQVIEIIFRKQPEFNSDHSVSNRKRKEICAIGAVSGHMPYLQQEPARANLTFQYISKMTVYEKVYRTKGIFIPQILPFSDGRCCTFSLCSHSNSAPTHTHTLDRLYFHYFCLKPTAQNVIEFSGAELLQHCRVSQFISPFLYSYPLKADSQ